MCLYALRYWCFRICIFIPVYILYKYYIVNSMKYIYWGKSLCTCWYFYKSNIIKRYNQPAVWFQIFWTSRIYKKNLNQYFFFLFQKTVFWDEKSWGGERRIHSKLWGKKKNEIKPLTLGTNQWNLDAIRIFTWNGKNNRISPHQVWRCE